MFPIVFSVSDFYVPYFGACLRSLLSCAQSQNQYRIIILEKDITSRNKSLLIQMVKGTNISLEFYNMTNRLKNRHFQAHHHVSDETFFKLFIPKLFPDEPKVLFCDSDIIFQEDPAILFATDMGKNKIAATLCHFWNGNMYHHKPTYDYTVQTLKLSDPDRYFQGGIILFQNDQISSIEVEKMIGLAEKKSFSCLDQDILNMTFQGHVHYWDSRWNYEASQAIFRESSIPFMKPEHQEKWKKAGQNPAIIHYSGPEKPWYYPNEEYADLWWRYARQTPFYEQALARMTDFRSSPACNSNYQLMYLLAHPVYFGLKKVRYSLMKRLTSGHRHQHYQEKERALKDFITNAQRLKKTLKKL